MKSSNILHLKFVVMSLGVHLLIFFPVAWFGPYNPGKTVGAAETVMVDLSIPHGDEPFYPEPEDVDEPEAESMAVTAKPQPAAASKPPSAPNEVSEMSGAEPAPGTPTPDAEKVANVPAAPAVPAVNKVAYSVNPPLRSAGEFLSSQRETLTYQLKLGGWPVGRAELEAKRTGGEIRISLKIRSLPAISAIFPVNDLMETRHINGNFIITRIRQQEGSFRSERGFTISLRDRSVFWIDLLRKRSVTESIPTSDTLDIFSALYYLRNRPLVPGTTEKLHVYDSESYAELPVEVLRHERILLPGKGEMDTLVVRPQLARDAVFRRTGDLLIWLTDDDYKVPVKIVTEILLGSITAELVSAETVPSGG